MSAFSLLPLLLGADNRLIRYDFPTIGGVSSLWLAILGAIVLSIVVGVVFAQAVRMKDYGWKIALVLAAFSSSLLLVLFGPYKLGVDLQGGVILVYEVDEVETAALAPKGEAAAWDMNRLVQVLQERLNETGLKEIIVRPFGPKQVEIVVPEVDELEVRKVKEKVSTGGNLQFMIVASENRDQPLFEAAREQATQGIDRLPRDVRDESGNRIGYWAAVAREQGDPDTAPFRDPSSVLGLIRDARTGQIIELSQQERFAAAENSAALQAILAARGIKQIDALMVFDPEFEIKGDDLAYARVGRDQSLRPCINFGMRVEGSFKMGHLTANNLERKLAIIFDNRLLSAPVIRDKISENGEITGLFTDEEVQFIVDILKSGSLPVVLHKNPISENTIGSILGRDTIEKGSRSVVIALGLVLLFMLAYYRFAGLCACFALTLNLMLTVAIMILVQAPLTLPGLAGLVLTVAMSVDANVLISERIREELVRGAALRMAIRNGFDKALSAIIDGNLTTFLTALVLYAIGTDQIRGFGMTLMLGNITSMFTAIFCVRVILEVAERTRWIKTLRMANFLPNPQVDWVKFFVPGVIGSVILIFIGMGVTAARGKGLFDIDLAGGTSVTFILKQPMPEDAVRKQLGAAFAGMIDPATNTRVDFNVYRMTVESEPQGSVYKVDSSLPEVTDLQKKLREAFRSADGAEGLKTFNVDVGQIEEIAAATPAPPAEVKSVNPPPAEIKQPTETKPAETKPAEPKPAETKPTEEPKATENKPAEATKPAETKPEEKKAEEPKSDSSDCQEEPATKDKAEEAKPAEKKPEDTKQPAEPTTPAKPEEKPAEAPKPTEKPAEAPKPAEAKPAEPTKPEEKPAETPATPATTTAPAEPMPPEVKPVAPRSPVKTKVELDFPNSAISALALKDRLSDAARASLGELPSIDVDNPAWDRQDNSTFEKWTVTLPLDRDQTQKLLAAMEKNLESDVVWQSSSKIGGQVSIDTRYKAMTALAVSLLGIVAYVWFRFQKVAWGLAAVAALAHDALVMLTGVAASYWLAPYLGFLGIEEFKISLSVVAAFLTILGYSVNDTIVIFDRLREIRGKSPVITRQMLNDAVNQTLGRTIILAGITLSTTVILFFFGGPGIHAFAFALLIGVISGCYTTLVIAAPLLLWLMGKTSAEHARAEKREMAKSA